jgi:hypothetical protein
MESNREVFLRMSEEHYLSIPDETRETFLRDKRVDEEKGDWSENMKDAVFAQCNKAIREEKKRMSEREYQLREERRKITIK